MWDPCPFRPQHCDCDPRPCGLAVECALALVGITLHLDADGGIHTEPRRALTPPLVAGMKQNLPFMIVLAARQDVQRLLHRHPITARHCQVPMPTMGPVHAACASAEPGAVRPIALAWVAAWREWLTHPKEGHV